MWINYKAKQYTVYLKVHYQYLWSPVCTLSRHLYFTSYFPPPTEVTNSLSFVFNCLLTLKIFSI